MLRAKVSLSVAAITLAGLLIAPVAACARSPEPIRIGVLLPLSGPSDVGWRVPLNWALDNINAAGGVAERPVELEFVDTNTEDLEEAATRLAHDDSIVAVIGPFSSGALWDVAPIFVKAQKPLISPSSTSGDITRAYADKGFIWRTVESDIGQLRAMLSIAAKRGVESVSLLTSFDPYGSTFFDWFGFFATELGMDVKAIVRHDYTESSCEEHVARAIRRGPEFLLAVPSGDEAICIARYTKANSPDTKLLFSDTGQFPDLIRRLGPRAEGLEGLTLSYDPSTGFEIAYRVYFDGPLPAYAANVYDALALLAYGLERSGGAGGKALNDAMEDVVSGSGEETGWDRQGIRDALELIGDGKLPDINGATGPLDFDDEHPIDLVSSTYALWRVELGEFVLADFLSTGKEASAHTTSSEALFRRLVSKAQLEGRSSQGQADPDYAPGDKEGLWAFIAATSTGWRNYRHQADALAQYQLLKANGVPDDRIILVLADDLATNPRNPEPGVVRNVPGGPDLYVDVEVDYSPAGMTATDMVNILMGQRTDRLPHVVEGSSSENVYVYIVGHGGRQGVYMDVAEAQDSVAAEDQVITPGHLGSAVADMFEQREYRRMLITIEACHSGVLGRDLTSPGVTLVAGANPFENSLATNYSPNLDAWLSDQFSFALYELATEVRDMSLSEFHERLYLRVPGSHVTAYNAPSQRSAADVTLGEFLGP